MPVPRRDIRVAANEVVIDLDAVPEEGQSAVDFLDLAQRKKVYNSCRRRAGVTPSVWASVLNISLARDKAYFEGKIKVPNSILNRARRAVNTFQRTIRRLKTANEQF